LNLAAPGWASLTSELILCDIRQERAWFEAGKASRAVRLELLIVAANCSQHLSIATLISERHKTIRGGTAVYPVIVSGVDVATDHSAYDQRQGEGRLHEAIEGQGRP